MSDQIKISQLPELQEASDDDILAIVKDPSGNPETKKITKANLLQGLEEGGEHDHDQDYAPLEHNHQIEDVTNLQAALDGKSNTGHSHVISDVTNLQASLNAKAADADLTTHTQDTNNPHDVTKAQVGLEDADNTSDADKPISTATQAALDDKADDTDLTSHTDNTDNPHNTTKTQVGLENVTNDAQVKLSDKASQAEAEGGTDDTKWMTALRTRQAIDEFASEAGEANTASNVGEGDAEVFKDKSGVDLLFRTLTAGDGINISENENDIEIEATESEGASELDDLDDVTVTTPSEGDFLQRNGAGQFVNTDFDTQVEANSEVAASTAARHAHANKATLDNITAAFTTAEETKLAGIAEGATANQTDAHLLDRDNHTGSQTANTISDFNTQVQTNRLDQMAAPTADVSLNTNKLTNVVDPTADQDAATKKYVDDEIDAIEPGAGGGEANTASNVGEGEGEVFKGKEGVDLEFKTLKAGENVTITDDADEVVIAASGGGGGGGEPSLVFADTFTTDSLSPRYGTLSQMNATVEVNNQGLRLQTDTAPAEHTLARAEMAIHATANIDLHDRRHTFAVLATLFSTSVNGAGCWTIGNSGITGAAWTNRTASKMGFAVIRDGSPDWFFINADGSSATETSFTPAQPTRKHVLVADKFPDHIDYYVEGVLEATVEDDLPDGDNHRIFHASASSIGLASSSGFETRTHAWSLMIQATMPS